jgi:hypothetical protein
MEQELQQCSIQLGNTAIEIYVLTVQFFSTKAKA